MSQVEPTDLHNSDIAPGDQRLGRAEIAEAIKSYLIGLGLATVLTVMSFFIAGTTLVWEPSIPVALIVLAIAQMGVHLVFFLHITTGPDNVNNVMALAFGVLIVLLLLTGSLWIMANLNHNMAFTDETMQMQPGHGPQAGAVTATGVIGAAQETAVAAHVPGVIQAIHCSASVQVKAGQLCAKIDPRPYQLAVDRSRASLEAAEARLEKSKTILAQAEAALESHEALAKPQSVSRKAHDKLRKTFEAAQVRTKRDEARVEELEAALRAAETSLGSTDIVSPLDGTVLSRNVELGQAVAANAKSPPLFVIAADLSVIHIDATIGARDSGDVKPGAKVSFTVAALPNRIFSGVVTQVQPPPQSSGPGAAATVIISAPNPDHLLQPGMAATIRIMKE